MRAAGAHGSETLLPRTVEGSQPERDRPNNMSRLEKCCHSCLFASSADMCFFFFFAGRIPSCKSAGGPSLSSSAVVVSLAVSLPCPDAKRALQDGNDSKPSGPGGPGCKRPGFANERSCALGDNDSNPAAKK